MCTFPRRYRCERPKLFSSKVARFHAEFSCVKLTRRYTHLLEYYVVYIYTYIFYACVVVYFCKQYSHAYSYLHDRYYKTSFNFLSVCLSALISGTVKPIFMRLSLEDRVDYVATYRYI